MFYQNSPVWCAQMDSNRRPLPYKGSALTTELWARLDGPIISLLLIFSSRTATLTFFK